MGSLCFKFKQEKIIQGIIMMLVVVVVVVVVVKGGLVEICG
jgi:hypothetical protein